MTSTARTGGRTARIVGLISLVAGAVMIIAGATTWVTVSSQLEAQNITVSEDADFLAGDTVDGPFSAYAQAQVIDRHALAATDGKTYAEIDKDDPLRATAMNASFLRASLFTSVVAYGVSALVIGLGLMFGLLGWALRGLGAEPVVASSGPRPSVTESA